MENVRRIVPNNVLMGEVKKMLVEGHPVTLKVKGDSMLPFIVGGRDSVRLVKPIGVKVRDIVLAELREGVYVLHRIKRVEHDRITLMGDGNLHDVEYCSPQNVVGKVQVIIRKKKEVHPSSWVEQGKVRLWDWLLPVRRWMLAVYRLL